MTQRMNGNGQRFVAQHRKNGAFWCVIDQKAGGYVVTSDTTLNSLSEEEAKRIADALNRGASNR